MAAIERGLCSQWCEAENRDFVAKFPWLRQRYPTHSPVRPDSIELQNQGRAHELRPIGPPRLSNHQTNLSSVFRNRTDSGNRSTSGWSIRNPKGLELVSRGFDSDCTRSLGLEDDHSKQCARLSGLFDSDTQCR